MFDVLQVLFQEIENALTLRELTALVFIHVIVRQRCQFWLN